MAALYTIASPHLYGIIFRILPHEDQASGVLEGMFKDIWENRHNSRYERADILNVLRAQAHRAAIEHKLANQFSVRALPGVGRLESRPYIKDKLAALKPDDLELLRAAYLDALPLDRLSLKFGAQSRDISTRLSQLVSQLLEAGS